MKAIFSVLSLLLVLAVVGFMAKKQLKGVSGGESSQPAGVVSPSASPQHQSQQIQQQIKQSLDAALHQARPMPDEQ